MKKLNFVSLLLGIIGILLFGFGMSCCLVPEFNAPTAGIVLGIIGILVLLVMLVVRRRMQGKSAVVALNAKTVFAILIGIVGTLLFGLGLCLCMVFTGYFIWGIVAAVAGIAVLLCLIPFCGKLE